MDGIINLYKESGKTSAYFVDRAKRILGIKKIGHFGTLDPQGTGVLVLGVGRATKLFDLYLKKEKVYEADFTFGYETDTLDGDGKIIKTTQVLPTENEIKEAAKKFIGEIEQMPPAFSAKRIGGKRAYVLARKGETPKLKPKIVEVKELSLIEKKENNTYRFKILCGSGTYIRSLCRDLAYECQTLATMTSIHRSRSGEFVDKDAITLQQLEVLKEKALIPARSTELTDV